MLFSSAETNVGENPTNCDNHPTLSILSVLSQIDACYNHFIQIVGVGKNRRILIGPW